MKTALVDLLGRRKSTEQKEYINMMQAMTPKGERFPPCVSCHTKRFHYCLNKETSCKAFRLYVVDKAWGYEDVGAKRKSLEDEKWDMIMRPYFKNPEKLRRFIARQSESKIQIFMEKLCHMRKYADKKTVKSIDYILQMCNN